MKQPTPIRKQMLDPSRGLGTFECESTGTFKNCCDRLDDMRIKCSVVDNVPDCVHVQLEDFYVNVTAVGNIVYVHCHPLVDVHPYLEFLMTLVFMAISCWFQEKLRRLGIYRW